MFSLPNLQPSFLYHILFLLLLEVAIFCGSITLFQIILFTSALSRTVDVNPLHVLKFRSHDIHLRLADFRPSFWWSFCGGV